ncbi:hypothetical protein ROE7235_02982 [Roseibaca ekhonensis]|uniref:Uncharacterized protein n=1 Tax=Roseinatronobacter ekhonensis TaxID=254356 RepID=A0A3B0MC29_9RHOB|nr:hypothetical protein ROE7235_02982 [Roseibaca ekhonensis]
MTPRRSALALIVLAAALPASAQTQLPFTPGDGPFSWESYDAFAAEHEYAGQEVTLASPWLGPDAEAAAAVLGYFERATGATVQVNGSDAFEQQIMIDVEAGSPPNLAVFPQPGLMWTLHAGDSLSIWARTQRIG